METYKIAVSDYPLNGKKLIPGDSRWGAFNASFANSELELNDVMDVVYAGKAITTHHKDRWRTSQNYLCGQHIGLDFDTEDERSTLGNLSNDKFIQKYSAFAHTTTSHTPEKPRARVIFLIDTPICQPKNYGLAATSLLWLFGFADRQCKDAVRFWYGAPGCEFAYVGEVLPLEVVKKLIANYQDTGCIERKRAVRRDYLPPASQQEVAEALKLVDPWKVEYDEWVSILMAIHSQFGEAGYELAETWGDGKQGEVSQKWKSFHQEGNVQGAVTIGTLFSIAKRFGWGRVN